MKMCNVIVFASWGLRHGHDGGILRIKELPPHFTLEAPQALILDLRTIDEANIAEDEVPIAVVKIIGDMAEPLALVMRQDEEQVHFIVRPGLRRVHVTELQGHLADLFKNNQLALNNFECNSHSLSSTLVHSFQVEKGGVAIVRDLMEHFNRGCSPDFHLRPGYQLQWGSNAIGAFEVLSDHRFLLVSRGSKNWKSRTTSDIGWTVQRYQPSDGRYLDNVPQVNCDLQDFDHTPQTVAALNSDSPIRRVDDVSCERFQIGVECARTSLVAEIEVLICCSSRRHPLRRTYVTLRSNLARQPLDEAIAYRSFNNLREVLSTILVGHVVSESSMDGIHSFVYDLSRDSHLLLKASTDKVAVIGPSGSGKSTFTSALRDALALQGKSVAILKLSSPLYKLQRQFYTIAGKDVSDDTQNQILLESIARHLRGISPSVLVDDLERRLEMTRADFVLNDDLRDDVVDLPRLRALGYKIIRIVSCDSERVSRLDSRGDITSVVHSELDVQVARIQGDIIVSNRSTIQSLEVTASEIAEALIKGAL